VASQLAVICVPSGDGVAIAPCGTFNGQALVPSVVEVPVLTASTVAAVEAAAAPFDYQQAGEYWAAAFGMVLLFFAVGIGVGTILRVLRD
jgi:hypothetical protein